MRRRRPCRSAGRRWSPRRRWPPSSGTAHRRWACAGSPAGRRAGGIRTRRRPTSPAGAGCRARYRRGRAGSAGRRCASHTRIAEQLSMRAANGPLKAAGMCWVIRIGGASGGIASSTTRIASVPPVEAPMAMIGLPPRVPAACARGSTASADKRGATSSLRTAVRTRGLAPAAASFTLAQISCAPSSKVLARSLLGLAKKSTAPSSSARSVTSAPSLGQRRHHHHRHRPQPHQVLEEREAVHARHLDVQREHVGIELLDLLAGDQRIGRRADHLDARIARQAWSTSACAPTPSRRR